MTAQPDRQDGDGLRQDREAFCKEHHPQADLTEVSDSWGRPMFKHPHVESMWQGWRDGRIALRATTQPPSDAAAGVGEAEKLRAEIAEMKEEQRLFDEDLGEKQRTLDRLAELMGLPHDVEISRTEIELFWDRHLTATPQPAPDAVRASPSLHVTLTGDTYTRTSSAPVPSPDGARVALQAAWDEIKAAKEKAEEDYGAGMTLALAMIARRLQRLPPSATGAAEPVAQNEIHSSGSGVESKTRKEPSADPQSLIAAGNVDSLGVAPGLPDFNSREAIMKVVMSLSNINGMQAGALADAILSLPVQPGAGEREALLKGFMTACSGDGEYQIKIGFETLAEMQAAHTALVKLCT